MKVFKTSLLLLLLLVLESNLTLTDFTLHFSRCFTTLLHSDFILLLNSFTLQEKCY